MPRNSGAIVNVASAAAFQSVPYMAAYGATNAYVLSFTESLWAETRGTGVRITALCPRRDRYPVLLHRLRRRVRGRRMSPEKVVSAALRALDRRPSTVIPGMANRLLATTTRFAARQTVARIAERTKNEGAAAASPQQA